MPNNTYYNNFTKHQRTARHMQPVQCSSQTHTTATHYLPYCPEQLTVITHTCTAYTLIRLQPIQNRQNVVQCSKWPSVTSPPHRQCSRYQGRKQSPPPHSLDSLPSISWHYTPSPSFRCSPPANHERQPQGLRTGRLLPPGNKLLPTVDERSS